MKKFICALQTEIEANNEDEAKAKFLDLINDYDEVLDLHILEDILEDILEEVEE